jgi:ribonuclease R
LDFDLPEVRAVLDEQGNVLDIKRVARLGTHKLIEDFMVAANEAVATFLTKRKSPALYRIHQPPKAADSADLAALLKAYRVPFKENELATPKGLQELLKRVKGHPLEATINTLALRSLSLAVYSPKNAGHFGLGLKSYCHFTSPIRRYPDVVVHRALKRTLDFPGGLTEKDLDALGRHTSFQERAAEKAEREGQKVKQLSFMSKRIGFETNGTVTHVTANGAFVEMEPWGVEGFVPSEAFPGGPYQFDEIHLRLTSRRGNVKLGDALKVKIETVDMPLLRLTLKPL